MKNIKITGARTHNLKNISLEIPKEKISVISGISGSGKSSLAFDTIFAEGQRRYVENLSSYAKQIIGVIEKPDVDSIEGIPPAISIDQKSIARSPRSTVGTLTEGYDYLRLIYSRFGEVRCPSCRKVISGGSSKKVVEDSLEFIESVDSKDKNVRIFAPMISGLKGQHQLVLDKLSKSNFKAIRIDSNIYKPFEIKNLKLEQSDPHSIGVWTLDKDFTKMSVENIKLIEKAILLALDLSSDTVKICVNNEEKAFSSHPGCLKCQISFPPIQPRLFSFNSPYGACTKCQGLGVIKKVIPNLVIPNARLTLSEGAIRPWARLAGQNSWLTKTLNSLAQRNNFSLDTPVMNLGEKALRAILYGDAEFEGVIKNLEKKYKETDSEYLRGEIEQYMVEKMCEKCEGKRLNEFALSVTFLNKKIYELSDMEAQKLVDFIEKNKDNLPNESNQAVNELLKRLKNLISVGLSYLALSRSSETLSGGEAQRIRLGVQFDSFLSGVLYVLDEPTIGLHNLDTEKMIHAFKKLRDEGNTVIIVEHDKTILESADYIFDMGPGAGKDGGYLIAQGSPEEIKKNSKSVTGPYLSGEKNIPYPKKRRKKSDSFLKISGARHNNLKNIDVEIPLGQFVAVSGVSGSGKSSLIYDVLAKALAQKLNRSEEEPGEFKEILGFENLNKVIKIDQTPIGRTPRSNLATYTGIFTPIRELFAATKEAKNHAFNASQFSFNLKGGRCETCRGDGVIKIEMYFMPDVYVPCEECNGERYNRETLDVKFQGKSVSQVLKMSVDEASDFFNDFPDVMEKITVLQKVGLGYLPLGQSATTLSGGEAQRIKLAAELSRPSTGKTIYILDEPTTGLHFEDIGKLLEILQELVERGNTVLIIEHNTDVIKNADWVIDMGPEGGEKGGEIIAEGTPEQIAKKPKSTIGKFLKF
ncbi:MAG: excinuclease ABC subunit UvrA [Candidatus Berkelbacteria bacterium]|nr:excinuclease ABC subunit UvrA [Candidatus Berkelbacteria bacterium]